MVHWESTDILEKILPTPLFWRVDQARNLLLLHAGLLFGLVYNHEDGSDMFLPNVNGLHRIKIQDTELLIITNMRTSNHINSYNLQIKFKSLTTVTVNSSWRNMHRGTGYNAGYLSFISQHVLYFYANLACIISTNNFYIKFFIR